jgi:hypothetical protein
VAAIRSQRKRRRLSLRGGVSKSSEHGPQLGGPIMYIGIGALILILILLYVLGYLG